MLDLKDRIKYRELFFEESKKLISKIRDYEATLEETVSLDNIFRSIHTLKAMSQVMGFDSLSKECHKFEIVLKDGKVVLKDLLLFLEKISLLLDREEKPIVYSSTVKGLDLSDDDFETILSHLSYIIDAISPLSNERKTLIFNYLKEIYSRLIPNKVVPVGSVKKYLMRVISTYQRVEKKNIEFLFSGEETIVDSKIVNTLTRILVQIIRNSIIHGVESQEERIKNNKGKNAKIHLTVKSSGSNLIIDVGDDGRGIDYQKLKKKLKATLVSKTMEEDLDSIEVLNKYIFLPHVTTKDSVDEYSGMGFGLSHVKELVTSIDGIITVESTNDKGINFNLVIPSKVFYLKAKIFKVGENFLAIEPNFINNIKKKKDYQSIDTDELDNYILIDFIKFFKSENQTSSVSVLLTSSDRTYKMLFNEEYPEEEIIILSQQNDLFWKGFTKSSQMVSLINLDYVRMNY